MKKNRVELGTRLSELLITTEYSFTHASGEALKPNQLDDELIEDRPN